MLYHMTTGLWTQGCLCSSDVADDSTIIMLCEGLQEHSGIAILCPGQKSTQHINLPEIETTNEQKRVLVLMHCFTLSTCIQ